MVKCPKCNTEMEELDEDPENMTEGQMADYAAGFNHPFLCPKCKNFRLYDTNMDDYINELVKIIEINPNSFEDVIRNALKKGCFIEAISLIHNVIEAYLKRKLNAFFFTDKDRYELLTKIIKLKYLYDYNNFCYIVGLINKDDYNNLIEFNKERNKVIHELLTKSITISELKAIARKGREMQLKLSPLEHPKEGIKRVMKIFDEITNEY